ncbi:class IV adenylate cyclase [Candidatus Nomurabacteria bacterium]|nr:MAG: class IV adenylate cyclase [Candidatus Nomurabacteria bacterium]
MRKEIEVKAKLKDKEKIIEKLTELGCTLSAPVVQDDITFVDQNYGAYDEFQTGKNILRIRESNGKFIFTLKQPNKNEFDAIEHETEIADPVEFKAALLVMGYKEVVYIHKERIKTTYQDIEICLDEVRDLGSFIEAEKIMDEDVDAEIVQKELFNFLVSLGVDLNDQVTHGYDTMVYIKQKS